VKDFSGPDTPGIGFAIGMERIIPLVKDSMGDNESPDIFICSLGGEEAVKAFTMANELRAEGIWVEFNYEEASLRSQMNKANRIGAKNVIVLGENELKTGKAELKNMDSGDKVEISLEIKDIIKTIK
jgi:histidyl-tRNA synthetase